MAIAMLWLVTVLAVATLVDVVAPYAMTKMDLRGGLTLASKDGWKLFGQVETSVSAKEVAIGGRAGISYNW